MKKINKISFALLKQSILDEIEENYLFESEEEELEIMRRSMKKVKNLDDLVSCLDAYGFDNNEGYELIIDNLVKLPKTKRG